MVGDMEEALYVPLEAVPHVACQAVNNQKVCTRLMEDIAARNAQSARRKRIGIWIMLNICEAIYKSLRTCLPPFRAPLVVWPVPMVVSCGERTVGEKGKLPRDWIL